MSIIVIESNPISSGDTCYVQTGQTVNFSIVSGITGASNISFEWYLNGTLVSIENEFNLISPSNNDAVYVKVINCSSDGGGDSGVFISVDGKTVSVVNGIITNIV